MNSYKKYKDINISILDNNKEYYKLKGKKLIGVLLCDSIARVMYLSMDELQKIELKGVYTEDDIYILPYVGKYKSKFEYNDYDNDIIYCSEFRLLVKLSNSSRKERFTTLPDIESVQLVYKNCGDDVYYLPYIAKDNSVRTVYEKRLREDFDGVYSNNIYQKVEYDDSNDCFELSIVGPDILKENGL